jgi:hypothetical protein
MTPTSDEHQATQRLRAELQRASDELRAHMASFSGRPLRAGGSGTSWSAWRTRGARVESITPPPSVPGA